MMRCAGLLTAAFLLVAAISPTQADEIRGEYLEARNADIWTGPCFANGEFNIVGNKATMAWKVTQGSFDGVDLSGRMVVAVVYGDKTFGLGDAVKTRALLIVDQKAETKQREALVAMVKHLAGDVIQEVVATETAPISMNTNFCDKGGCARLDAGIVKIRTRCMAEKDAICGHEDLYYPILTEVQDPYAAYTVEHIFTGKQMNNETFAHGNSRSAVIAQFAIDGSGSVAAR
jgi:hypothetical protein